MRLRTSLIGLSRSSWTASTDLPTRKYPKFPTFRYHLGLALLEKGDKQGAKKELDAALASHPSRQDEARIRNLLSKMG